MTDPEARMIGRITQLTTENEALRMRADTTLSPELLQQIAILRAQVAERDAENARLLEAIHAAKEYLETVPAADDPGSDAWTLRHQLDIALYGLDYPGANLAPARDPAAENARLREQSNERFSEIERARRIITELTQWRESWLTRPKRSTRQMRDRAVELATPPRDDFDRAVLAIIADVEAEDDARRANLAPARDLAAENARLLEAITASQAVLAQYIAPDSGISALSVVNDLLGILDHRDLVDLMRRAALSGAHEEVDRG